MMTKEQASQAWCPMTRMAPDAMFQPRIPAAATCVSEQCAMWRWSDAQPDMPDPETWSPPEELYDDEGTLHLSAEPARPEGVPVDAIWEPPAEPDERGWQDGGYWVESAESVVKRYMIELAKRRGYCGLAGRPE